MPFPIAKALFPNETSPLEKKKNKKETSQRYTFENFFDDLLHHSSTLSSFSPDFFSPPRERSCFVVPPIKLAPPPLHFPVHDRRLGSCIHEQKGKRGVLVRIPIQLQTSVQLVAARAYDNVGQGGEGSESAGRLRRDRESVGSVSVWNTIPITVSKWNKVRGGWNEITRMERNWPLFTHAQTEEERSEIGYIGLDIGPRVGRISGAMNR